jgi:hypothetical protein
MALPSEVVASSDVDVVASSGEKIAAVEETAGDDFSKSDFRIDDEAGSIAAQALASGPAEAEISKRVLRKIDLYILPFLCITYGVFLPRFIPSLNAYFFKVCNSWTRRPWDILVYLVSSQIIIS